jgi:hypothetical protein
MKKPSVPCRVPPRVRVAPSSCPLEIAQKEEKRSATLGRDSRTARKGRSKNERLNVLHDSVVLELRDLRSLERVDREGRADLDGVDLGKEPVRWKARATSHQPTEEKGIEHSSLTDFSINLS